MLLSLAKKLGGGFTSIVSAAKKYKLIENSSSEDEKFENLAKAFLATEVFKELFQLSHHDYFP